MNLNLMTMTKSAQSERSKERILRVNTNTQPQYKPAVAPGDRDYSKWTGPRKRAEGEAGPRVVFGEGKYKTGMGEPATVDRAGGGVAYSLPSHGAWV